MANMCMKNFKIYKQCCGVNSKDSILLTNQIKVSRTTFPEQRDPSEALSEGAKSVTWINNIHGIYTIIRLSFFLDNPENIAGAFSFPTDTVTVRVVADPPGAVDPPGTPGGSSLNVGALLASQTFNTPGFKVMYINKPITDTVIYVGYTESVSDLLISTDKPRIFGMRMEFII